MSRTIIPETEIDKITSNIKKLTSYSAEPYPLNSLTDREFEVLLYFIYQKQINDKAFMKVTLMSGVGERGRDVVLSLNGKDVGIIQCKKHKSNIDKPTIAKEIIKFCLYQIVEKDLMPKNNKRFMYIIATSTGLTNTAKKIVRNSEIIFEDNEQFIKWTDEVINEYATLRKLDLKVIYDELLKNIQRLDIEEKTPQDINKLLISSPEIVDYFFKVQKVTDNRLLEKIIKKYLDPILISVNNNSDEKIVLEDIDFKKQFKKYLEDNYEHYSYARTLVFGNQQKKLEDFYIPLTIKCTRNSQTVKIENYPTKLINTYKKILISDTGGMGKSTIMKWLFLNSIKQSVGLPIFIELRSLKNTNLVLDEILKKIQPIDKTYNKEFILKVIGRGNFIFFFDGFDEIGVEHRDTVIEDLQNFILKANNNNTFILTSRPESALATFADFQEFKINPLEKVEAFELIRKLGNSDEKSERLIDKIKEQKLHSINEFLENPLLVSLLFKKFEYRETLPFDKRGFYNGVFDALFEGHDITKDGKYIRSKKSKLSQTQFHQLLRALGFTSIKSFEVEYTKTELIDYVNKAIEHCPNLKVDSLDFIQDLVTTVPLFLKDADIYRWQHKSIQEYFAAEFICNDTKNEQENVLKALVKSEHFDKLRNVITLCYEIDYKTFRNVVLYNLCKEFIKYCNSSFTEIQEKGDIPIAEIRKRQGFCYLHQDRNWYIVNLYAKKDKLKELLSTEHEFAFNPKKLSIDNFLVAFAFTKVKKPFNVRLSHLLINVNSDLVNSEMPIYPILNFDNVIERFKHWQNSKIERKKFILFGDNYYSDFELISDDSNSVLNHKDYFANVNNFLCDIRLNYNECLELIEEVEKYKNEGVEKGLASGF